MAEEAEVIVVFEGEIVIRLQIRESIRDVPRLDDMFGFVEFVPVKEERKDDAPHKYPFGDGELHVDAVSFRRLLGESVCPMVGRDHGDGGKDVETHDGYRLEQEDVAEDIFESGKEVGPVKFGHIYEVPLVIMHDLALPVRLATHYRPEKLGFPVLVLAADGTYGIP